MNNKILNVLSLIYGKKCNRVAVGNSRSLSFGFGEKIFHNNPRLQDKFYCEWEIGSYYRSWRVINNDRIILGSNDPYDDLNLLNNKIHEIAFTEVISITNISALDVRVTFNNRIIVDFLSTISDEDEGVFHIFCPEHTYIEFTSQGKWKMGKSNVPWNK
jgi:hypothetical protein